MYGWRARIALIIAQSNTTMEPEFYRVAPPGVSVHTARVRVGGISVDGLVGARLDLERATADLAAIDAAVFAYACTSANFVMGLDGDLIQGEQIERQAGRPAITNATALVEALAAVGAKRIALATPYPDELNEPEERFLESCGIEIVNVGGVDLGGTRQTHNPLAATPVSQVGLQPAEVAYRLGRAAYVEDAEAIVISGANLRTLEIIQTLETDLGVPVISSGQAMIWSALQLAGVRDPIPGYGRLLAGPLPLPRVRYGTRLPTAGRA